MSLPEGIYLNAGEIADIPVGSLYTDANVARVCTRCGHEQCPCCENWCDICLGDHAVNAECARDHSCVYASDAHPSLGLILRTYHQHFANVGGSFGVTDDLRVWYHGQTETEVIYEETERARAALKLMKQSTRDRAAQMNLFETQFLALSFHERAAYLAGMNHAMQLGVWRTEDAKNDGKKTSTRMGQEFIANLNADIEHMNKMRTR